MKNKLKKIILNIIIFILILGVSKFTFANDKAEIELKEYSEKYLEWFKLPEEEKKGTIAPFMYVNDVSIEQNLFSQPFQRSLSGMKSQYDIRNYIELKVKNQKTTSSCWAFSVTTMLESYMGISRE